MSRPRLLFLGDSLPYPPDRGRALRSYHVLRLLGSRYDVDALLFHQRDDPTQMPLPSRLDHLRALANVELFRIPHEWSVRRRVGDRIMSRLSGQSTSRFRYQRRDYARRVVELLIERGPRVVHVDRLTLHAYLPLLQGKPVVVDHDRVESEYLRREAALAGGLRGRYRGRYLRRQAELIEEVEREWLPRVALNVARSEADRETLAGLAPDATIEVWPDGVDTGHFTPGPATGRGLAYVGGTTLPRDRDALDFFAGRILPGLRSLISVQALEPISWIGTASDSERRRYGERGIDLTGYVEDIRPLVRPAACFIVPLRIPAAARFKVLLAWAMGKAVVSTSAGCDGLDAVDGENILIRDTPESFARAIADVLQDRQLRTRLGHAARSTVEARYSWDILGPAMMERYQALEQARELHS